MSEARICTHGRQTAICGECFAAVGRVTKARVTPETIYGEVTFGPAITGITDELIQRMSATDDVAVEYLRLHARETGKPGHYCRRHGPSIDATSCAHCSEDERILEEKIEAVVSAIEAAVYNAVIEGGFRGSHEKRIGAALRDLIREVRR